MVKLVRPWRLLPGQKKKGFLIPAMETNNAMWGLMLIIEMVIRPVCTVPVMIQEYAWKMRIYIRQLPMS
ncbi:protein of unknown function [Xenorhabdus poinarii G6]|uniref:Uncharacterized protein n=1 Tax=Xenorhabdus poinarii G6 TaxID=1354304 RepID=A0A068R643_9GAMM|nr:protein of unknown function [Xenorhabdus poinarii G6]